MSDLTTQAQSVSRVQTRLFYVEFAGLAPNTTHTPYLDGVDHSFATRQTGKEFGEALITDSNGDLGLYFMREISWARIQNFELPQNQSINYQNDLINSTGFTTVRNIFVLEVKSANEDSYAQRSFSTNILLTAGAAASLFPIE